MSNGNDVEDMDVHSNRKVAVDRKSRDQKVAAIADKGNESCELDELAKITLGTGETYISVESEETEAKDDDTKDDDKLARSPKTTHRRLPTGGYTALNNGRKELEKKENKCKPKKVEN